MYQFLEKIFCRLFRLILDYDGVEQRDDRVNLPPTGTLLAFCISAIGGDADHVSGD